VRGADSATGYTTQITKTTNPNRLSFSSKHFYLNRLFPDLLAARIGIPPIDQINTTPQSAVHTRYAGLKHRPPYMPSPAENPLPRLIRSSQHSIFSFQTIL
jgi:hypothetical protein